MTPLDYLKRGLTQKNWDDITKGYAALSGEVIEVNANEEGMAGTLSFLGELEEFINEWIESNSPTAQPSPPPPSKTKTAPPKKKKSSRKKVAKKAPPAEEDEDSDSWAMFRTEPLSESRTGYEVALAKENTWKDEVNPDDPEVINNQLMTGKLSPSPRTRRKVKQIKRKCAKCSKEFALHPDFRARRLDKEDDPTSYICDSCLPTPALRGRDD